MDPLWTFNHTHRFSDYQKASKERQQKSHALFFRGTKYNTFIFGSSRTTYMNQYTWGENTFNYAVSDMQPNEYIEYLDFAINKAKQPIKKVIIGLDFFGALTYAPLISKKTSLILNPITTPFYRYKLLLSIDSLHYSFKNIKYSFSKPSAKYNFKNIKNCKPYQKISLEEYTKNIQFDLNIYVRDRYSKIYDINYKNIISNLINSYPNIEFIVFTTPVSQQHFHTIIKQNLYTSYERWLRETTNIFGRVNHFMYKNELTNNAHLYFQDSNHAYNSTYDCLTNEILEKNFICPKTNIILTPDNLNKKLYLLKKLNKS